MKVSVTHLYPSCLLVCKYALCLLHAYTPARTQPRTGVSATKPWMIHEKFHILKNLTLKLAREQ